MARKQWPELSILDGRNRDNRGTEECSARGSAFHGSHLLGHLKDVSGQDLQLGSPARSSSVDGEELSARLLPGVGVGADQLHHGVLLDQSGVSTGWPGDQSQPTCSAVSAVSAKL